MTTPDYTDQQLAVIRHRGGHARVSAVPGSGKTAVLVGRVRWLIEQGVAPERILVLMFNRSARESFSDRLQKALGDETMPQVLTFHALGYRALKEIGRWNPAARLELAKGWQCIGTARQVIARALNRLPKELQLQCQEEGPSLLAGWAEEHLAGYSELTPTDRVEPEVQDLLLELIGPYHHALREKKLMTFTGMLVEPLRFIDEGEPVPTIFRGYSHLLVDEYQDVNLRQQQMIDLLVEGGCNLMAVGDPDQCIYTWRGARPELMTEEFMRRYPGAQDYRLSYTFRYGRDACVIANRLIAHNVRRIDQRALSAFSARTKVRVVEDPVGELHKFCRQRPAEAARTALLYRDNGIGTHLQPWLMGLGIPFHTANNEQFWLNSASGVLLLSWLQLLTAGPSAKSLSVAVGWSPLPLPAARLEAILADWQPGRALPAHIDGLNSAQHSGLQQRLRAIDELLRDCPRKVGKAIDWLGGWVIRTAAQVAQAEGRNLTNADLRLGRAVEHLKLLAAAPGFGHRSLADLIGPVSDSLRNQAQKRGAVLSTMHGAKGLEWSRVIVYGLSEGTLPSLKAKDIEEERRLFYVGITRARDELWLEHAGRHPSPFLAEALGRDQAAVTQQESTGQDSEKNQPEKPTGARVLTWADYYNRRKKAT